VDDIVPNTVKDMFSIHKNVYLVSSSSRYPNVFNSFFVKTLHSLFNGSQESINGFVTMVEIEWTLDSIIPILV
jgi:hypothetical protein